MKFLFIFLFYTFLFGDVIAQSNFTEAMQQGDESFNNGLYKNAINKYFAAEAFDPSKKNEVKDKISKVFNRIELLRLEADSARKQALTEKERALKAEKEQGKQKIIAIEQKEKLEALNSFMKYNNEQLFNEIQRDKASLLYYSLNEYRLLNKYNDSLLSHSYRLYSLFAVSQYYERNYYLDSAYNWANSMCQLFPDSALSFLQRSIINYYMGNWNDALADVDTTLLLNPDQNLLPVIKFNQALILCNLGRYDDSRKSINEAKKLLRKMPETEAWSDHFISQDIIDATSIYTLFMTRDYQIKTLEIYKTINDIYEGIAPVQKLENFGKEKLHTSILLSIINFTTLHLKALPNDYIGYLVKGFFWEMANYEEPAKTNYRLFIKNNKELQNKKYHLYKNNFNSPIYNKLKN